VIKTVALSKHYLMGDVQVDALREINLNIDAGEFFAVLGPSGSGKSTLMNILGCLDVPTAGQYWLNGREVSRLSDNQLAEVRNRQIGFVFQSFNLMPRLTALDNVIRPLVYRGMGHRERLRQARQALEQVGLQDRMDHRPTQLSGGQQQRVAVARAIAGNPATLFADETNGNLDTASGEAVMALLKDLHRQGRTVVMISHNPDTASLADRWIKILDGRIVEERRVH
jgi:putative ABC transport system ATP-binding protein